MKVSRLLSFLLVVTMISTLALYGYDVNKDLKNTGTKAYDIAVVLSGPEDITETFDGYKTGDKIGHFDVCNRGRDADQNTILHWQNFTDGGNNAIDNGQVIHVGWSTADHSNSILDMYWTNYAGKRITGNVVINVTPGMVQTSYGRLDITWRNDFRHPSFIDIRKVHYAILETRVPLAELNAENEFMQSRFVAIPENGNFQIAPGQSFTLPLPVPVTPGMALVLRYEVLGTGSDAESLDFVQYMVE